NHWEAVGKARKTPKNGIPPVDNLGPYYPPFCMVSPSCTNSTLSMATSFPSDFRSVGVTLVGQAFFTFHTTTGSWFSFSKEMIRSLLSMVFKLTVLNHS